MTVQARAGTCARCSSPLQEGVLCPDETCPFSDHDQTCPVGWVGHCESPAKAEADGHVYADEDAKCACAYGCSLREQMAAVVAQVGPSAV